MDLSKPIGADPKFHREIRVLRLALGFDYQQFADALGVSLSSVNNWEKEYNPPYSSRPNSTSRVKIQELIDAQPHPSIMPPIEPPVTTPAPNGTFSLLHMSVTVSAENLEVMSHGDRVALLAITNQVIHANATSISKAYEIKSQLEKLLQKS